MEFYLKTQFERLFSFDGDDFQILDYIFLGQTDNNYKAFSPYKLSYGIVESIQFQQEKTFYIIYVIYISQYQTTKNVNL